jgi:type IV pilus secretin PilQ/predicted competence protein
VKVIRQSMLVTLLLAALLALVSAGPSSAQTPETLVSLDAEDAYLPSVLKILAEKGNLNVITGPGVTGERISIHMKDVPVEQAVNLVVRAAGLAYERIGRSILVADPDQLREETGLSSYVVDLQYADAIDVKAALADLSAQIQVDTGGNRLIVVTSPRVIAEIQQIVSVMDVPARQVMIEARIVEVSIDDAKQLGIDWGLINRQSFIIVEGKDNAPAPPGSPPDELPFIPSSPEGDLYKFQTMSRQAKDFVLAIDLLIEEGNARVLAQPKIATLNGREATMLIGQRIPFVISSTVFAGGAAAPAQRIEKEEVGIKLGITPLINADGYITTTIRPEVSTVVGFRGLTNDLPVIATREASTTVRLKDGNSVIIGGLLSEEKTQTVTKVPVLGSIPVIGYLFQHHDVSTSKRDLVIEVTPRILPDVQQ